MKKRVERSRARLHPPEAPEVPRRVRMKTAQWVALAILLVFPVLALAGLLDPSRQRVLRAEGPLEMAVDHPSRLRYRASDWLTVGVRNRSPRPLSGVTVQLDSGYLESFAQVSIVPDPRRAHEVELPVLPPGETSRVSVQVQGERYGRRRGEIAARAAGLELRAPIATLVLP